ncbi:YwqG family protein [Pseudomonas sp. F(2018)]|uniref:YwqG family protein n=1 Tax=Pseudomonas sp. F(2018) TaxID=2502240 RepID=UPI0010F817A0|nr:YwqG family protein [Pseudomonas sp. F(2018)]
MDINTLNAAMTKIGLAAAHVEYIRTIARPSVDIEVLDIAGKDDSSRFGGDPYVPHNFKWPTHNLGEYRFLGQINFSEVVNLPSALPDSGLLSLFYAYDEEGEIFWGDDGYVLGFYWKDYKDHVTTKSPSKDAPKAKALRLTGGVNIPENMDVRNDWPFEHKTFYELTDALNAGNEYLLGYPSFYTLAYDPTPGPEWVSLLTLSSRDEFGWCWHDGDKLMVFIESDRLVKRDFSNLKSDAG